MREAILDLLMGSKDFISGEDISRNLGVSRTAIWKNIKKLKDEGFKIESITNKGYRIVGYPSHFVEYEINNLLKDINLIEDVIVLDTVDSTNQEAESKAETSQCPHTAGRRSNTALY